MTLISQNNTKVCNACIQYMRHCFRKKTTTLPPSHSASYNIASNHHYHHHHHSTSCHACIQYMHHCSRLKKKTNKKNKTTSASLCWPGPAPSTLQTTTCAREYMFSMVEYEARYRASYRRSESASPLLACTMLQAHVTCIRVCH